MDTYTKKISLIGDGGCGKTSLVRRFVLGEFDDKYVHTIGVNVKKKVITLPDLNAEITLMIWDIQGQRNNRFIFSHILKSEGALVVCDITRDETFTNVPEWIALLDRELGRRVPLILLANKFDMKDQAMVSEAQLRFMASKFQTSYHYTSAKTGQNVEEAFRLIGKAMIGRK